MLYLVLAVSETEIFEKGSYSYRAAYCFICIIKLAWFERLIQLCT